MLKRAISKLDDTLDSVSNYIKKEFNKPENVIIQAYRGYGNEEMFRLRGRVLEMESHLEDPKSSHDTGAVIKNFWYMFKRFESDEIPEVEVFLEVNGNTYSSITDNEGYFYFEICESLEEGWNDLNIYVLGEKLGLGDMKIESIASVLIPDEGAEFGVISDIDDTIMKSYIPKPVKMLKELVFNGAHRRVAFEGTGKFYQGLAKGETTPDRPIFFVSGSPWNIYDVLTEFIEYNDFPHAPLFLKELGVTDTYIFSEATKGHKIRYISELMDFYNTTPFLLIGDSGQEDAEIYNEIIKKYPSRIKTVYIRDVIEGEKSEEYDKLVKEISKMQSELIVFEKTKEAAKHALESDYISTQKKEEVGDIPEEVKKTTAV